MLILKNKNIFNVDNEIKTTCFGHGCNIYNTMGKGIAYTIKQNYPKLYQVDQETKSGDRSKLGTFTHVKQDDKLLFNLYTQATYWDKNDMFKIDAYMKSLKSAIEFAYSHYNKKVDFAIPAIGLGYANGDLNEIVDWTVTLSELYDSKCDLYWYVLDKKLYNKINQLI
jgi:O-acetyl-ADP-ribose deacetylase (regulator of RNase III)